MTKQIGSLDVHFLVEELKYIENSRIDKIYNFGKDELYFQFFKSGKGKKIIKIILGKALYIADSKTSEENPSHFCMMLRKHLSGKTLVSIDQIKPERIIKFVFKGKEETKKLYIEVFAKGNAILCDDQDIILESVIKHRFRDRAILPREEYKHPKMKYNYFKIKKEEITNLFKESKKDKVVTLLAIELGLGGICSEEVCLLSKVDKNQEPKKITKDEIEVISKSIRKLIKNKPDSQIIYENKEAVDVLPFSLNFYKEYEKKKFTSFSEALDYYFTNEVKSINKKESKYEGQINELKRIIGEQETTFKSLKDRETENRKKAELIYNNYQLINEILKEINKAKEKHSWEEIKKRLKGHKVVKDLDVKEKKVVIEV